MLDKLIDSICRLFIFLMVVALGLMVVMVFSNVVLRYGFNSGLAISEELSRWLFVWMTFLGAVVALRNHAHLGTDALVSRLPIAGKRACFVAAHLLMLYMCWLMFSGAWQQTKINYATSSAVMEISTAWLYVSGLLFAALAALIIGHELWKMLTGRLDDAQLIGIVESEDAPQRDPHPQAAVPDRRGAP